MHTNRDPKTRAQGKGKRIAVLREAIRRSFPAKLYAGKVTPNDDELDDPELDEDRDLHDALKGRKWTGVPTQFLRRLPDGYGLLTDEAFVAFLPAWLMYSLKNMDVENEVRNFLVYAFSNTMRKFRVLNPDQRLAVRSLLAEFAERDPSARMRNLAAEAVALVDRGRY